MPLFLIPIVPALAAVAVALLARLAARWRAGIAPAAVPAALLAGAVVLTLPFNLRAVWAPRVMADALLLVALAGWATTWLLPRLRRRWLASLALAMVTGWWLARTPPALPEFWRTGFAVTVYALVLTRSGPSALVAAAVAGAGALLVAGAAPVWQFALLIPAGAGAAMLGTGVPAASAGAFLAAGAALASLAGGRAAAGRITGTDIAAAVPLLVAVCWPAVARRLPALPARGRVKPRVAVRRRRA